MLTKEEWRRMEGFETNARGIEGYEDFMKQATKAAYVAKEFRDQLINHEIPQLEVHRLMRMIDIPNLLDTKLINEFEVYNSEYYNLSKLIAAIWIAYSSVGFTDKQSTDFTIIVYQDYLKAAERSLVYGKA